MTFACQDDLVRRADETYQKQVKEVEKKMKEAVDIVVPKEVKHE